jgi:hypothetical protein
MDRNAIRERLLTGFKPKEKDLDTPYLEGLEKEFKLVGVTGKESLDMTEQATDQIIAKDGTVSSKVNGRKLASLRVAACLRVRSTGEPVYSPVDVLGENGDGNGALLELDDAIFQQLISDIYAFIGKKDAKEVKADLKKTESGSDSSSLPPASDEPLMNSSEASIPAS